MANRVIGNVFPRVGGPSNVSCHTGVSLISSQAPHLSYWMNAGRITWNETNQTRKSFFSASTLVAVHILLDQSRRCTSSDDGFCDVRYLERLGVACRSPVRSIDMQDGARAGLVSFRRIVLRPVGQKQNNYLATRRTLLKLRCVKVDQATCRQLGVCCNVTKLG
jgi:hypothetical protein